MLPISAYAVATPGLESIVAAELAGLGFVTGKIEAGGVPFECDAAGLYRANLQVRTATRVLVRVSQFKATGFNDLEKHARRIDWPSLIAPNREIAFRVTSRKSRLYHGRAIEERLQELLSTRVAGVRFENAERGERNSERRCGAPTARRRARTRSARISTASSERDKRGTGNGDSKRRRR